jgi:hypothetical protein
MPMWLLKSVGAVSLLLLVLGVVLTLRNMSVFLYRQRVLERASKLSQIRIDQHLGYDGRYYKQFDQVSYYRMVIEFWRPLSSYYKGKDIAI